MNTLDADELIHLIRQTARAEAVPGVLSTWGYVAAYDVDTHSIQAVLPTFRTASGPGGIMQPVVTDWIQLGTPWSGDGFGDQMSPYAAAATPDNPGGGEQVQITVVSGATGASYAPAMLFNQSYPPPGGVAPGERIIKSQGAKSVKFGIDQVIVNAGGTPVAVEGSKVTHDHALTSLFTVLAEAGAAAVLAVIPMDGGAAAFAAFNAALASAASLTLTDIAGAGAATQSQVDAGQGAQDFLAPGPGDT